MQINRVSVSTTINKDSYHGIDFKISNLKTFPNRRREASLVEKREFFFLTSRQSRSPKRFFVGLETDLLIIKSYIKQLLLTLSHSIVVVVVVVYPPMLIQASIRQ